MRLSLQPLILLSKLKARQRRKFDFGRDTLSITSGAGRTAEERTNESIIAKYIKHAGQAQEIQEIISYTIYSQTSYI